MPAFASLAAAVLLAAPLSSPSVASAERCPAGRSPIMILGTFHMANPGLDAVDVEADDVLSRVNRPERWLPDRFGYIQLFEPDADAVAIYEKADLYTNWHKRNFRMWANVVRRTDRPADRVFLMVGSGHLAILRGLAQAMPGFCLVEPEAYLTQPLANSSQ